MDYWTGVLIVLTFLGVFVAFGLVVAYLVVMIVAFGERKPLRGWVMLSGLIVMAIFGLPLLSFV